MSDAVSADGKRDRHFGPRAVAISFLIGLVVAVLLWRVDVTAEGRFVLAPGAQVVRAVSTAPVTRILVQPGQPVVPGTPLIEVSDGMRCGAAQSLLCAEIEDIRQRVIAAEESYRAELIALDTEEAILGSDPEALRGAKEREAASLSDELDRLNGRATTDSLTAEEAARREALGPLVKALEDTVAQIDDGTRAEAIGAERRRLYATYRRTLDEAIADIGDRRAEIGAPWFGDTSAISFVPGGMRYRSKVQGVVRQINLAANDATVPGEPMIVIERTDGTIEAIAAINHRGIGYLETEDQVKLSLEAFNPALFGAVEGRVTDIARVPSRRTVGRREHRTYPVRIALVPNPATGAAATVGGDGRMEYPLRPGMEGRARAVVGRERWLARLFTGGGGHHGQ